MGKPGDYAKRDVLERVKKLLALAQSPNENEAAVAAEKAQMMMLEHNIKLEHLGVASNDAEEDFVVDMELVTDSLPWRRRIANALAHMFLCGYVFMHESEGEPGKPGYRRWDRHMFTGEVNNIAITKVMFAYLTGAVDRGAVEASRGVKVNERGRFRVSFKTAAAERLSIRIYKRIVKAKAGALIDAKTGNMLPAVVDMYDRAVVKNKKAIEEFSSGQGGELKSSRSVLNPSHKGGVEAGRALADKLGLDQQVETNKTELLR